MEKEDLEIRKASEELTAEDLANVTGGTTSRPPEGRPCADWPSDCAGDCNSK